MHSRTPISLLLLCLAILFGSCSLLYDQASGRPVIDETETIVLGVVQYGDSTPVRDALIQLHSQESLQITRLGQRPNTLLALKKTVAAEPIPESGPYTYTNINGIYRIDSVPKKRYFLEVNDHDTLGALVEADLSDAGPSVTLDIALRPLSRLDLSLSAETPAQAVFIEQLGRWIELDAGGKALQNLPEGDYNIILYRIENGIYTPLDTLNVRTQSGKETVTTPDTTIVRDIPATGTLIIEGAVDENIPATAP